MQDHLYELPKNCDFSKTHNASNQEFECSPKLKDKFFSEFHGLLINAPEEVLWPKNHSLSENIVSPSGNTKGSLRFMVTGLARLKYKELGLKGKASYDVVIVAVNQTTAKSYSGRMPRPDYLVIPPPVSNKPEISLTEADQNALLTSHYNFDLIHDIGVPIGEATYTIYATLGELKSNTLTVATRFEK